MNSRKSTNLHYILQSFGLKQLINDPTRITKTTSSLIDVILVSKGIQTSYAGTLDPICSDHCPVYVHIKNFNHRLHAYKRTVWKYDSGDYHLLRHTIQNSDWNMMNLDIDAQVFKITENISCAAAIAIPSKEVTIRPTDKPWFHSGIRYQIRLRNRLHRNAKSSNSDAAWAKFRSKRNEDISLVRKAKLDYYMKLSGNI